MASRDSETDKSSSDDEISKFNKRQRRNKGDHRSASGHKVQDRSTSQPPKVHRSASLPSKLPEAKETPTTPDAKRSSEKASASDLGSRETHTRKIRRERSVSPVPRHKAKRRKKDKRPPISRSPSKSDTPPGSESDHNDDSSSYTPSEEENSEKEELFRKEAKRLAKLLNSTLEKGNKKKEADTPHFKVTRKKDANKWKVGDGFAICAKHYMANHYETEDLEKSFLGACPVPSNIPETPEQDEFLSEILAEKPTMKHLGTADKKLYGVHEAIRRSFAALASAWTKADDGITSEPRLQEYFDIEGLKTAIEQATALVGQSFQSMHYYRQSHFLKGLSWDDARVHHIMKVLCKEDLKEPSNKLFGDSTHKKLEKTAKQKRMSIGQYLMKRKRKKPFPYSQTSTQESGERGGGRYQGEETSSSSRGYRGKNTKSLPQHKCDSLRDNNHDFLSRESPSHPVKNNNSKIHKKSSSRKNKIIPRKLEEAHRRPKYTRHSHGMENSLCEETISKESSKTILHGKNHVKNCLKRNRKYVGKRSNKSSPRLQKSVHKQHFREGEERRRSQAHNKPEATKCIHTLCKIQNGNLEKCQRGNKTK